ncbi:MAG: GNAT family N-acetyltransferase [Nakamurella sp.]
MSSAEIEIRQARSGDADQWVELYRGYRTFYRLARDDQLVNRVWTWVTDPTHEVNSLVAVVGPDLIGLANHRRFARPSSGTIGLYLDDLYTAPAARGRGVGGALLAGLSRLAERDGLSVVRWITATDNDRARRLYDRTASSTTWVTYDLAPDPS